MHQQRLHDGKADGDARVQRGKRVLEDELDIAAQPLQRAGGQVANVLPAKLDHAALAFDQAQQRAAGGRFAATRFADQRQRFAGPDVKADFFNRVNAACNTAQKPAAHIKASHQILHPQDRRAAGCYGVLRLGGFARCRIGLFGAQQVELERQFGALHRAQPGHGRQQRAGVGMARAGKDFFRSAFFHLVAAVHHQHAVGHLGHHAHVVRDEDHAHAHLVLQCAYQLQDLRLDGHVQRRGGFVGDQQRGLARQRHGDHHALAHAARELVRIAVQHIARFRNAHEFEHAQGFGACGARALSLVLLDRFCNLVPGGEHRVERGHGLLENHGDVSAPNAAQRRVARLCQVKHLAAAAPKRHAAVDDAAAAMLDQAHQRQRGDRFAGARFADDGQGFTAIHMEGEIAHRIDRALGGGKAHRQVVDGDHPVVGQVQGAGLRGFGHDGLHCGALCV